MKKTSEKIVFFGSGSVAAKSLEMLAPDFDIEAVITKPAASRPNDPVPVIDLSSKLGLKTILISTKTELEELFKSHPVKAKLALIIDYGIIVPQSVIDYFPLGIINSHFSLLPKWRGADPITFSILSGEAETGVSLMLINSRMDEGLLLKQARFRLQDTITSKDLTEALIELSHKLLVDVVPKYINHEIKPFPQDPNVSPSYSRKLVKADGQIDWNKPADQIEREIRAYSVWPKSYINLKNLSLIITKAHVVPGKAEPGSYLINGGSIIFNCAKDALMIDKLKPAGKPEMEAAAFLAGYRDSLAN